MIGLLIAAVVCFFVGKLILKCYSPHATLIAGGLIMLLAASFIGEPIADPEASTGNLFFDFFNMMKDMMSSTTAGLGLTIMVAGGYAKLMDHFKASNVLVDMAVKPLGKLNSPYLVLALGYVIGQLLNVFVPSASGLSLLLMVTLYPVLVRLGASPLSATAMIATSAALDLGPASGNANMAAETAGILVADYFMGYQIPAAAIMIPAIAVMHYFTQKWFDKREGYVPENIEVETQELDTSVPRWYALLPCMPLIIILAFGMHVQAAMLMCALVSVAIEMIRTRNIKDTAKDLLVFFDAMGRQFARVVTLVIAGQIFAEGLKNIGAINTIIDGALSAGITGAFMTFVIVLIIAAAAILMGSGNAPFFSFSAMIPEIASKSGISAVSMLLPTQLASGIARSVSPISGVVVAVAGVSNVSPFDVVKRTLIPMTGSMIIVLGYSFVIA